MAFTFLYETNVYKLGNGPPDRAQRKTGILGNTRIGEASLAIFVDRATKTNKNEFGLGTDVLAIKKLIRNLERIGISHD